MERAFITVDDLLLDDSKAAYIFDAHNVHRDDVLHVFLARPRFFAKLTEMGIRYNMLGPTGDGRFLLVAIRHVESTTWRVVTAYWLNRQRAETIYHREG